VVISATTRNRQADHMAKAAAPKKPAAKAPAAKAPAKGAAKAATPAVVSLKQLAASLAESHEMPKKQAETIVNDFVQSLADHLKEGAKIRINGLGILEVKSRPARMGRNPATGEQIQIAASKKIAFRPAKELKEAV
jgi:DNA-binding protein HU-beta